MGTLSSWTARASVLLIVSSLSTGFASAGGWGHGPNFGGYHPFYQPVPAKPLDGIKVSLNDAGKGIEHFGKTVGPAIAHPFEELFKSIKDPWGWQKKAQQWYDGGLAFAATALAATLAALKQFTAAICLVFGFGFGALALAIVRRRPRSTAPLIHPLHA